MNLKILGCSGGIGGVGMRTTSFLLDGHILIDAGTGVGDLSLEEMAKIDHVFLTHAHMDHIASLPLLLDSVIGMSSQPLQVHAPVGVIEALQAHIFNWIIWPDFSVIPTPESPCVVFVPFELGSVFDFEEMQIQALPAYHHVCSVAYEIRTAHGSTVFSGDTRESESLKETLKALPNLRTLIIECAFPNQERLLADRSGHFCPESLFNWLKGLPIAQLCITHLKPQMAEQTMREVEALFADSSCVKQLIRLEQGQLLEV